jgi:hypothetical protein
MKGKKNKEVSLFLLILGFLKTASLKYKLHNHFETIPSNQWH